VKLLLDTQLLLWAAGQPEGLPPAARRTIDDARNQLMFRDSKDLRGTLDEAMNFRGPALVNAVISQGSARKPQQFRWHS
jgi:hypothetical protein